MRTQPRLWPWMRLLFLNDKRLYTKQILIAYSCRHSSIGPDTWVYSLFLVHGQSHTCSGRSRSLKETGLGTCRFWFSDLTPQLLSQRTILPYWIRSGTVDSESLVCFSHAPVDFFFWVLNFWPTCGGLTTPDEQYPRCLSRITLLKVNKKNESIKT